MTQSMPTRATELRARPCIGEVGAGEGVLCEDFLGEGHGAGVLGAGGEGGGVASGGFSEEVILWRCASQRNVTSS